MFSNSFYFFHSEFSEIPLWIKIVQLVSLITVWLIIKKHSFSRWFWIPIILTFPVIGTVLWILFSFIPTRIKKESPLWSISVGKKMIVWSVVLGILGVYLSAGIGHLTSILEDPSSFEDFPELAESISNVMHKCTPFFDCFTLSMFVWLVGSIVLSGQLFQYTMHYFQNQKYDVRVEIIPKSIQDFDVIKPVFQLKSLLAGKFCYKTCPFTVKTEDDKEITLNQIDVQMNWIDSCQVLVKIVTVLFMNIMLFSPWFSKWYTWTVALIMKPFT